jgi:hypothetical protein
MSQTGETRSRRNIYRRGMEFGRFSVVCLVGTAISHSGARPRNDATAASRGRWIPMSSTRETSGKSRFAARTHGLRAITGAVLMLVGASACGPAPDEEPPGTDHEAVSSALIIKSTCGTGQTSSLRCGHDELKLGYIDRFGACVWVCCRPNSDGRTYNCTGDPSPSDRLAGIKLSTVQVAGIKE